MKTKWAWILALCLLLLPVMASGETVQEMMKQRGDTVLDANDELIQRTVRAYGGNYYRQKDSKILIFNGKVHKTFSIQVIDGKYVVLETPDGAYRLNAVDKQ